MVGKKFEFNVNKYTIEQDGKFVAYLNVVDAHRIVGLLNKQFAEISSLKRRVVELELLHQTKGRSGEIPKDLTVKFYANDGRGVILELEKLVNEYYTANDTDDIILKTKSLLKELDYYRKANDTVDWQAYKELHFEGL